LKKNCLIFALLIAPAIGRASVLFSDAGGGNVRTGDGFSLGAQFTVSAPGLEATGLGIFDLTGNALASDHEVGLWDVTAGNVQVADVTVLTGTSNGGVPGFVFVPLPLPVILINGDQYRIAPYYSGTSTDTLRDCCQGAAPTTDPSFTSVVGVFTFSNVVGHLSEPTGIAGHPYVGPNLQFQPIPEPGSFALMLAGAALLGGSRLRSSYRNRRR